MNVSVIYKANVTDEVLDALAGKLPAIISELLEVRGAKIAILKPEQISLQFSLANVRDVGADLRIIVLARSVGPRTSAENKLATAILDKVLPLAGDKFSIAIRLYLTEIGAAEYAPA
ncbi:hypothetical protein Gbem_0110 [Citrifermentans bemidjiense Bem]|uniref:Uncharacterized protein n=1 Tax=Citrifermentans bemidjiense (strain ATCC BAA-1014 / DSM 16622 / JCM 12645 / Bem) TaxID=404380 RepID=B5E8F8_CITBB|nr:hypothetical protein [Citrifermentans bemidjiense]ACH37141.1 hypothetical protein Gbem_0110 [Citrifermentans bemidjiense Bem]